jgi:uncharacterized protein
MNRFARYGNMRFLSLAVGAFLILCAGCSPSSQPSQATSTKSPKNTKAESPKTMTNPVLAFEIPVRDMTRAIRFYEAVFGYDFGPTEQVDGNEMAWFPLQEGQPGASGALVRGESYRPSLDGSRLYFSVQDIQGTLKRANQQGAKTLYPITSVGNLGYVAEFEDSEGNRIALHARTQ